MPEEMNNNPTNYTGCISYLKEKQIRLNEEFYQKDPEIIHESSPRQRQQYLGQKSSVFERMKDLKQTVSSLQMEELSKMISLKTMEMASQINTMFEKQMDEASFKLNSQVTDMLGVHKIKPLSKENLAFMAEEVSTQVFSRTAILPEETTLVLKPVQQHDNYGDIMWARNENINQLEGLYFSKFGFRELFNTKKEKMYEVPGGTAVVGDNYITYGVKNGHAKGMLERLVNTEAMVGIKRESGFAPQQAFVYCNNSFLKFRKGFTVVKNPQECYDAIAKCASYHDVYFSNEES